MTGKLSVQTNVPLFTVLKLQYNSARDPNKTADKSEFWMNKVSVAVTPGSYN